MKKPWWFDKTEREMGTEWKVWLGFGFAVEFFRWRDRGGSWDLSLVRRRAEKTPSQGVGNWEGPEE